MKRLITVFCLALAVMLLMPAYASEGVTTEIAGEIGGAMADSAAGGIDPLDPESVLGIKGGDYSVDYLGDKLEEKGMDVVYLIKVVGRYICLAGFVICVVLIVVGIIGNPRILLRAAIGAVVSGIAYALITCGEEIVLLIATWAAS